MLQTVTLNQSCLVVSFCTLTDVSYWALFSIRSRHIPPQLASPLAEFERLAVARMCLMIRRLALQNLVQHRPLTPAFYDLSARLVHSALPSSHLQ